MAKKKATTQRELRAIARETLAAYLQKPLSIDPTVAQSAIQVLHAPQFKGE